MDEPAVDPMPSSSIMEDSRAQGIDAADGGGLEEQQITQNTTPVTMAVEAIGAISQTGSVENEVADEEAARKAGQNLITPKPGMTFQSEAEAYEMYNTYAGKVGFSIRKSKTKHRRDGKHPNTIFTDQDAAMAGAIAYVFPNTSHRLCLWHICLNAAKHLSHVIHEADKKGDKFLTDFKNCVYEDRSETYFIEKWHALLAKYNLESNTWMANLYTLRAKWAAVYRDSFTAHMNSTQRSEGMNNVFKKRFRRKLGLSELLVECEKVAVSLRANELDADFKSHRKNPVPYAPNLPMLKTAAESYTRRMYSEFEEEFKRQFTLSCDLLHAAGTNLTFFVRYMESDRGATVVLNTEDSTITCSCRMFETIGLLCKHALRVFNINRVYNLPSQYILPRWTKYAKTGFYIEKQGTEMGDLKTQAALISRQATSLALKCSPSKELLEKLQKAIHNLNLEADTYLSEMHEKSEEVSPIPTESVQQPLNGVISFRIPEVIKGPKNTRFKNAVEKKAGKKKKAGQKKGEDLGNNGIETRDECADPNQVTNSNAGPSSSMDVPFLQGGYANSTLTHFNLIPEPSAMAAPCVPGGYTGLLMGGDQDATMQTVVRKLHFGVQNHESM